jgi:hypothetical protein
MICRVPEHNVPNKLYSFKLYRTDVRGSLSPCTATQFQGTGRHGVLTPALPAKLLSEAKELGRVSGRLGPPLCAGKLIVLQFVIHTQA